MERKIIYFAIAVVYQICIAFAFSGAFATVLELIVWQESNDDGFYFAVVTLFFAICAALATMAMDELDDDEENDADAKKDYPIFKEK